MVVDRSMPAAPTDLPSPLAGEGARRADEGYATEKHRTVPQFQRGRAKQMRHEPTEAERRLWHLLRHRRLSNFKFRRQFPIDRFIADFVCLEARLIIEADGSQHADSASDSARDDYLHSQNFHVLRLWNDDILARPGEVMDAIWSALGEDRA